MEDTLRYELITIINEHNIVVQIDHCLNIIDKLNLERPLISELDGAVALEYRSLNIYIFIGENLIYLFAPTQQQNKHFDFGIGSTSLIHRICDKTFILCDTWEQGIEKCCEQVQSLSVN